MFWSFISVEPLSRTSPILKHDPFLVASHNSIKELMIIVAQDERIWHLETTDFLIVA